MPQLTLPQTIADAIIAHAREGQPEEVCGLLRGRDGIVTAMLRARNVAPHRALDYEVDPQALLIPFEWEDAGDELIGIYHSHPASPAYPSASDAYNAHYPDSVYVICSLQNHEHPALNGFYLRELAETVEIEAVRGQVPFYETRPGRWAAYIPGSAAAPPALAHIPRAPGLALYVVYEQNETSAPHVRIVTVEPVEIRLQAG